MWVLKARGQTYYVNHVDAQCPWSTKETPDNPHTKGALKFRNVVFEIDDNNQAKIRPATALDLREQKERDHPPVRVTFDNLSTAREAITRLNIKHDPIVTLIGSCGEEYYVMDLQKERDFTALALVLDDIRRLMPNEYLYKEYTK